MDAAKKQRQRQRQRERERARIFSWVTREPSFGSHRGVAPAMNISIVASFYEVLSSSALSSVALILV